MRAENLGFIERIQAQRLWINYSRRGWRKQEPLDNAIEPEAPTLPAEGFKMLLSHGIKTRSQILRDLSLSANDIEELAGLTEGFLRQQPSRVTLKMKPAEPSDT